MGWKSNEGVTQRNKYFTSNPAADSRRLSPILKDYDRGPEQVLLNKMNKATAQRGTI
jgi:hypothetical protein